MRAGRIAARGRGSGGEPAVRSRRLLGPYLPLSELLICEHFSYSHRGTQTSNQWHSYLGTEVDGALELAEQTES